jgi:hypothetical protein
MTTIHLRERTTGVTMTFSKASNLVVLFVTLRV